MALNSGSSPTRVRPLPIYATGLVLVLAAERIFSSRPPVEWTLMVVGELAILAGAAARFIPRHALNSQRLQIERLMAWLTLGVAAAVGLALLVQHQPNWFAIRADLTTDLRDRRVGLWNIAWLGCLLLTLVPLLFAEAALYPMRKAQLPEARRIRAAAVAGLTLALVALYGSLFVYAGGKFGVAIDYSYFKTARASESTKRIAKSLKEPIRVVALFPAVSEVRGEVERYLRDLSRGAPKIKVEFHDRLLEPKIARELRASQDGSIILARGEVRHVVNVGVELKNARTVLRNLDQEFQKNLMKLARDARVAYLTIGHGELNDRKDASSSGQGVQIFRKLLETQNFRIQDLGVPQGLGQAIPEDADVVFVLGPRELMSVEELATLDRYSKRGGHLFLALDVDGRSPSERTATPASSATAGPGKVNREAKSTAEKVAAAVEGVSVGATGANLDELGRLVGIQVEPGTLANDRVFVQRRLDKSDFVQLVTNRFSSHASVSTLSRNNAGIVLFGAGALNKIDPKDNSITFVTHAMPGSYIDKNGNYEFDESEARSNFELAAAVTRPISDATVSADPKNAARKDKPKEFRAFVLGDADVASDLVLMNAPTNRVFLMDAVRWLVGEESFAGEVSSEEDVRIEHTKEKDVFWFYATILGAPAVVLGLGLSVARRNRSAGGST